MPDADAALRGFSTPMFLLPLFRAAEREYGVPWTVLAAVNAVETDYGRNLAVSSAGAVGWMQFMPASWRAHAVDADGDGRRNPWDRADAIFTAAAYLRASGAAEDMRSAVFAYNHADWYVDDVLGRAERLSAVPDPIIDALTQLALARPVLPSSSRYRAIAAGGGAASLVARPGTPVLAAADARVVAVGSAQEGAFVVLRDAAGNRYTYRGVGRLARTLVVSGRRRTRKSRLFAHPTRTGAWRHGGSAQLAARGAATTPRMRLGATVRAGSVIGFTKLALRRRAYVRFSVRLSGSGPTIDARRLLAGWRQAERDGDRRAIPRSGPASVLSTETLSDRALAQRVLGDPRISIYRCGRDDIARGIIDRRVLTVLAAMADRGLAPTVSSLNCGHSYLTASGKVSEHSIGSALDIAAVNGVPIAGHQEPGGITERTVRWLMRRPERPHQVISLLELGGPSFALDDHGDHIHVGFSPDASPRQEAAGTPMNLSPAGWRTLMSRVLVLPVDGRPR